MSVAVARLRVFAPADRGDPRWVIASHVGRSALPWAIVWGTVFGLFVYVGISAFVTGYPTLSQRLQFAGSLESFAILLGPPRHAETVAGFITWRVTVVFAVVGGIWGLLTSTGLMRGEEDAGRWELLLAGRTTRGAAAAQALLGLGAALGAMFLVTAVLTLVVGRQPSAHFPVGRSLLFAVAMVSGAAMFLAVGALASQLSANRGQAATLSAVVLGVSFVVRMVADSQRSLGWMRWLSPIGWVEELRPLRDPQPVALLPMIALVLVCAWLTVWLAGQRDLNSSVLREGVSRRQDTWWLVGPTSLAVRLSRASAVSWLVGTASIAVVEGLVARSAGGILTSSPAFTAALRRLGVRKASEGYLGVAFLLIAVLLAVIAASQIAAIWDEEASGRLDNLLVRPVRRIKWLAGRLGISLAVVILAGAITGLFTWVGAASQHTGVGLPKLLEAGLNATIPAVFVLGAGALVLGLRPRLSAVATYGIVVWSFLVNLLGSLIKGNEWLRDSSLFSHMELAPAAKPDWGTAAVLVLLGLVMAVAGAVAFQRRDVEYQ